MKTNTIVSLMALAGAFFPATGLATNPGLGRIPQPVNLGAQSDPARIPLGVVGVYSNYGYGSHRFISEPRVCPQGAMRWEGGLELNQNLASVFGITVEPEDSSSVPGRPVILRMRAGKPPAYSPYTKEQVLAATLWSLARCAYSSTSRPLEVRVVAEGEEDKPLEAKFSGNYVNPTGDEDPPVPPLVIPGTVIETDGRGIPWVVFPDIKSPAPEPKSLPVMIPIRVASADDYDGSFYLLPTWGDGTSAQVPLILNHWHSSLYASSYGPNNRNEANSIILEGGSESFNSNQEEGSHWVVMKHPKFSPGLMAANVYALVISAQPTAAQPLTVGMQLDETGLQKFAAFRSSPGWTEKPAEDSGNSGDVILECKFVWNPETRQLAEGTVPNATLREDGTVVTPIVPDEAAKEFAKKVADEILIRINQGIADGTLAPETSQDPQLSPLEKEARKAAYYAALVSFCNEQASPVAILPNPLKSGHPHLDQHLDSGWLAGRKAGQEIATQARTHLEAEEATKLKVEPAPE